MGGVARFWERMIELSCERKQKGRECVRGREHESYWDREAETNVKSFTEI